MVHLQGTHNGAQSELNKEYGKTYKCPIWTKWHKTRNYPQEMKWEKPYYMEAKQYATKNPVDQWGKQRGNLKIPRDPW